MLRIEPLTDEYSVDILFMAQDEFVRYRETLRRYLEQEGFNSIKETVIFWYQNRHWHVSRDRYSKKTRK
jgi:hypothetical protein